MTLEQLSEATGAHVVWLRRLCRDGRLEARKVGQTWIVEPSAVDTVRGMKYRKGKG